uniref:Uncharacterized protein n=1 Tax=Oryza nivara TaxID=4536 RepID=A0A0E0HHB9_ORYNI
MGPPSALAAADGRIRRRQKGTSAPARMRRRGGRSGSGGRGPRLRRRTEKKAASARMQRRGGSTRGASEDAEEEEERSLRA